MTASVAATATLNANSDLGEFDVTVDDGAVLTLTSAQASGVTITSDDADAETAAEAAGSVTVTLSGATGETADDYSGISLGGAYAEGEGTAGVFTIAAEGDNDVTGMTLGDFTSMTINGEGTITMTSAQANGASVAAAEAGENASIVVSGILADVDLGEVSPDGEGTLTATTTGSVDLTGATLGDLSSITVDDGDGETDTDHTMTLTGLQAAALSTNTAGEAADAEDATDAEGPDVALGVDITGLDAEDSFSLTIEASTAVDGEGVALDAAETGLTIGGSSSADTITGTQAADSIVGNAGADIISGGTGADVIVGGTGRDTMTGGEGADQFWFVSAEDSGVGGANRDIIADFAEAGIAGGDNINLSLLNGDGENAGEGTLEFIGTNSFTGTGGAAADTVEVRYTVLSGNAIVEIDFDGDGGTDMQIQVNEVDTLVAADFTLA
jgi:Ca2+-binding RTX toxin-like protein